MYKGALKVNKIAPHKIIDLPFNVSPNSNHLDLNMFEKAEVNTNDT